jgi:hypothetical protein
MKVGIIDTTPRAGLGAGSPGSDAQHLRWRAELERAQWQARLRYTPAPVVAREGASEPPAAGAGVAQAPSRAVAPITSAYGDRTSGATTDELPPPPRARAVQLEPALRADGMDPAVLPSTGAPRSQALAGRASATRMSVPQWLFEPPYWPACSAQACLQGRRLSVVLRDAQLADTEWPALRQRLQAQCQACGLELAELVINGVTVEPETPVA